jgi:uncharacterized protein (DUF433 family)
MERTTLLVRFDRPGPDRVGLSGPQPRRLSGFVRFKAPRFRRVDATLELLGNGMSDPISLRRDLINGMGWNMRNKLVTIDPEIMSGEPVFTGTRVPVRNLIDYLSGGHTLDDFLKGFPGVKRRQAIAFLERSSTALLEQTGLGRRAA